MSARDYDRLNRRRTRGDFEEQRNELNQARAEERHLQAHTRLVAECPAHLRPWLMGILRTSLDEPLVNVLLHDVAKLGFLRAALMHIDMADADGKDRRRGWAHDCLPADDSRRYALLLEGLHDEEPYWRSVAAKWISMYAPDDQTAVGVLTDLLRNEVPQVRWHAALQLGKLAPQTTGLVEVLCEAVQGNWIASHAEHYDTGINGAGAAARVLAELGQNGLISASDP